MPTINLYLGENAEISWKAGLVSAGGAFAAIPGTTDVSLDLEAGEASVLTRGSGGWETVKPTGRKGTIDFEVNGGDPAEAGFAALRAAFFARTTVAIKCLDKTAGQGVIADCYVTKFRRNEPMQGPVTYSVTLRFTNIDTPPAWTP